MKKVIMLGCVLSGLLLSRCIDTPTEVPAEPDPMPVTGLDIDYAPASICLDTNCVPGVDSVVLTWNPPPDEQAFDFYRVYRTAKRNAEGGLDTSKLTPTYAGRFVDKAVSRFSDIPGLENDVYLYAVRAARVVQGEIDDRPVWDTIYGRLDNHNMDSLQVGNDVSFNINEGKVFTAIDKCNLVINDPGGLLESVRFTQNYKTYLVKPTGEKIEVSIDDYENPPTAAVIANLIDQKFLTNSLTFAKSADGEVERVDVPDFDAIDSRNRESDRTIALTNGGETSREAVSVPWLLKKGNGTKRVWAEFHYAESGLVDTVTDKIEIAPWRIQLNFRNKINATDATMSKTRDDQMGTDYYNIYKPWVRFSVSVFADTTTAEEFDYWMLTSEIQAGLEEEPQGDRQAWLETPPVKARLTGIGPSHDDEKVYTYMLHADSAGGKDNLSKFLRTSTMPNADGGINLATPPAQLNETTIAGAYWGENAFRYRHWERVRGDDNTFDTIPAELESQRSVIKSENPQAMYQYLMRLEKYDLRGVGKKEFTIVARFKGRFFDDTRVMVAGSDIIKNTRFARWTAPAYSYFDLYNPIIRPTNEGNECHLTNGSVIASNFCFALGTGSGGVADLAFADVTEISLVIAKKPSWMTTEKAIFGLTLRDLFELRADVFPYEIKRPDHVQYEVEWENIDPSSWPSGEYIMAVITADQYGNRGFAPINNDNYTNPWVVTVQSGK